MRIFDIEHERAQQATARSRNVRDAVPYPFDSGVRSWPHSFGPTVAPYVSDVQVLGIPAAWRAVNLIANGVAAMAPLDVFAADGVTQLDPPAICVRPNATLTTFAFWHLATISALMRGNFVGILADFDRDGYPRQVVPVPPQLVDCHYVNGLTVYDIGGARYSPLDVVHVPAFLLPGQPWGVGPVEVFRRSLGHALEQQHLAADTYSRGSVPSGVLTTNRPRQDKSQAEEIQEQWIDAHGAGQRKPAVIPQDWKFEPLSWSPEDAQFLEARQFTVAEQALLWGLDPSDLGASLAGAAGTMTYANIEQRVIARVTDAYGPWAYRFEQAWSDLIPGGNSAKFVPENLLRTDAKTRAEVHQLNIASGVETKDEARHADGRPPLTPAQVRELAPPPAPAPPALNGPHEGPPA